MKINAVTVLAALAISSLARGAFATPIPTLIGDSGTLMITTPSGTASTTVSGIYGTPPFPAITTTTTPSWQIVFDPSSDFYATASSSSGGKTTEMDGTLTFTIHFSSPVQLASNVLEEGSWSSTGNGTVGDHGTVTIAEDDHITPLETLSHPLAAASFNSSGIWTLSDQLSGFAGLYSNYTITIKNDIVASAPASQGPGTAYMAKQNFSIILTDTSGGGGGGGVPEPASLGILGMGALALVTRRSRA